MPQFHLITAKLAIVLSVLLMNLKAQGHIQQNDENSRKSNLATENDNELLVDINAKNRNTNHPHQTQYPPQPTRNCTSASGVQFNQTHQSAATEGSSFVEICQHHVNNSSNNESDEVTSSSSSNQKSNVMDTSLCFDESSSLCNHTREEYMQQVYDYLRPGVIKWILILSHSVVFVIGLMGNALVCLAVYVNYSMRTVTNIFIVNLAVADFLVILVCLPPSVVWDITETWFLGETMCKIVLYIQTVSVTVSVLTLTLISIDRWYAICFPLRYRTKISRAITSVSIIWIIAILLDIPEFLTLTVKSGNLPYESVLFSQCTPTWSEDTEKKFYNTQLILLFVFPLLLMIAAYFKIATVLWKSDALLVGLHTSVQRGKNSRLSTGTSNKGTISQLQARRKAAKMMVVVVIMFAVCYLPVHIFNILRHSGYLKPGEITKILALCSHWLIYANSAINPVIYNFMSGKFRREFRNAFVKCRCSNVRVEDNFLYKNGPSSRQQNNSVSMRSYHNLSVREITRVPYASSITQKNDDSHL